MSAARTPDPTMSQSLRASRRFSFRLAAGFGSLMLAIMGVFAAASLLLAARNQMAEEDRLSSTAVSILAESIQRVSFSGKYQTRLLVEEMMKKTGGISYISVESLDGTVIASSDPLKDGRKSDLSPVSGDLRPGNAVSREYRQASGHLVKEVALPYRGGIEDEIQGIVRVGIDVDAARAAQLGALAILLSSGLLLTLLAILGIALLGRSFGAEMSGLANTLEGIIENSPVGMAVTDRSDSVIRINRKFIGLFGYSLSDIPTVGEWFLAAYPDPQDRERLSALWEKSVADYLAGTRPFPSVETQVRCKDGTEKSIEFGFSSLGGYGITTFMDVTDRRRAEEERLVLERQMLHVQKLESMGVLAGGIAHDFNNILMAILGHADLARMKLPPASPVQASLDEIMNAAKRAADLSRQMLAYSGRGRFMIEPVDLSALIGEMAKLLSSSINKRARLRLSLQSDLPPVCGDATQLRQVVMNLITNASEALGEGGGDIELSTEERLFSRGELDSMILGPEIAEGDYVSLRVKDSGCGMDEETVKKIFEPFFTTKFTGRGLGMAAVQGIVRGHHGAIRIETSPGKGTEFLIILPVGTSGPLPVAASRASDAPPSVTSRPALPVLIVDDEESVREVGAAMLSSLGFQALIAASGEEAVRMAQARPGEIRAAIIDLTMPGMDGLQTLEALLALEPGLQAFISSGYTAEDIGPRFSGETIAGFIQKPYDREGLSRSLGRLR